MIAIVAAFSPAVC